MTDFLIWQIEKLFGEGLLKKASEVKRPSKKIVIDIDGLELSRMGEN